MRLWLIGMMGSGKTSAGRLAALRLDVLFVDTDEEIEKFSGVSLAALWRDAGEEEFRALESAAVSDATSHDEAIVATGGGAILRPENREVIKGSGEIVWLNAGLEAILNRLGDNTTDRPLLSGALPRSQILQALLSEREDLYRALADHVIDSDRLTVDEAADEIVAIWKR